MASIMTKYQTGEKVILLPVCAWCPLSKQRAKVGSEYTHGICDSHLESLQDELAEKRRQKASQHIHSNYM